VATGPILQSQRFKGFLEAGRSTWTLRVSVAVCPTTILLRDLLVQLVRPSFREDRPAQTVCLQDRASDEGCQAGSLYGGRTKSYNVVRVVCLAKTSYNLQNEWLSAKLDSDFSDIIPAMLRPGKLLEMIVSQGGLIKPRISLRVAYEVGAARQQTVRSPRTMYPQVRTWHQNREATVYLPA
jgi:hypothetical protein